MRQVLFPVFVACCLLCLFPGFAQCQAPSIQNLGLTSGGVGVTVLIGGSNFGATQGSSTVTFNGTVATASSWSGQLISVTVPGGATTGNIVVTVNGTASNGVPFTVTGPGILGLSSQVGAVGDSITIYGNGFGSAQGNSAVTFNGIVAAPTSWNNIAIAMPVPAGATTGPVVVTAGGVASNAISFTVGLPDTISGLTITSPANNASVSTPYAAVTGTITGSISGIDPIVVTCNNVVARVTGTNYSCNPPLSAGVSSIVVTGADSAGDSATATVSVTMSMAAPASLTITPGPVNLLVGQTQPFTAIDQTGTRRPDATWSVSDTTIASFVTGSPNTFTGNAVGQVTLTATVAGVSGQTTVTVLSGTSLPVGTVLWSATPVTGFTTQQIVQAVPTTDGPDLYAIDTNSDGDILVRAFKGDGEQLWQAAPSASVYSYVSYLGDNSGGILMKVQDRSTGFDTLVNLDAQTGGQDWQYSLPDSDYFNNEVAVGPNGTVYVAEFDSGPTGNLVGSHASLNLINGATGALMAQVQLPVSSVTDMCSTNTTQTFALAVGPPMVAPDGSVYFEGESWGETVRESAGNVCIPSAYSEMLYLMRVTPGGSGQSQVLASYSLADWNDPANSPAQPPAHAPGDVIPDGQDGALASWVSIPSGMVSAHANPMTIADIAPQGKVQDDFSSIDNALEGPLDNNLVLGDNGTAFVTDGTAVVGFNVTTLQPTWTYTTSGGTLSLVAATSGGGVTINDSQQGLIQLDANGSPRAPIPSLQSAIPFQPGLPIFTPQDDLSIGAWNGNVNGEISLLAGPYVATGGASYPEPSGEGQEQRAAVGTVAGLTVNFSGPLTTGDHLSFSGSGSCGNTLGFRYCSQLMGGDGFASWYLYVEGVALVSDDASKWTVHQHAIESGAGYYKSKTTGLLAQYQFFFDSSSIPGGDDPCTANDPRGDECNGTVSVQQQRGQRQIFWVDDPGSLYLHNTGEDWVDSLNMNGQFTSTVCNRYLICTNVRWFMNLVIDPGSNLDLSLSSAGLGNGT